MDAVIRRLGTFIEERYPSQNEDSPQAQEDEGSLESQKEHSSAAFPFMSLPVEIRAKIYNMLNQSCIPYLRTVCKQWKEELDEYYEYSCNIYDLTPKLEHYRKVRCRECIVWKFMTPIPEESLFLHPMYLRIMKIYGPISSENLKKLISFSANLEQLIMTKRANYPWILNTKDTPALKQLKQLKLLRLTTCQYVLLNLDPPNNEDINLPMMDCYFPKLENFEILKRYPSSQYATFVKKILQFVSRHHRSLKTLILNLIPLTCIGSTDCFMLRFQDGGNPMIRIGEAESLFPPNNHFSSTHKNILRPTRLSANDIDLAKLKCLKLKSLIITTEGREGDIDIWKEILSSQKFLRELRFDWLRPEPSSELLARANGYPWIHFKAPILSCAEHLVHIELSSLSMCCKNFYHFEKQHYSLTDIQENVTPFDLSLFSNCKVLKSLQLRARESHCQFQGVSAHSDNDPDDDGENRARDETYCEEVLLAINLMELPSSIDVLEIISLPMLTYDIAATMEKLTHLRKCYLKECGKTGNLGVTAEVVKVISKLPNLRFLDIVSFNDSTAWKRQELETVFQAIGRPFRGSDTWLEFDDGRTSAHQSLKNLQFAPVPSSSSAS